MRHFNMDCSPATSDRTCLLSPVRYSAIHGGYLPPDFPDLVLYDLLPYCHRLHHLHCPLANRVFSKYGVEAEALSGSYSLYGTFVSFEFSVQVEDTSEARS